MKTNQNLILKERVNDYGTYTLNMAETISFVTGISIDKLSSYKYSIDIFENIHTLGLTELQKHKLNAIRHMVSMMNTKDHKQQIMISSPKTVANILYDSYLSTPNSFNKEIVKLISLNTKHQVIAIDDIGVGTINACLLSPRDILVSALHRKAVSVIIAHNHSGNVEPSEPDILVTKRIHKAFKVLDGDLTLLDHLIIDFRKKDYFSFKEGGLL